MKYLQKFAALVLVLACVSSLVLPAGAATLEYKDASKITAAAAVSILTELGVVNGYEDNSFKPLSVVTRAEMAKLLTVTLNKGNDVSEEYVSFCTFADTEDHWAKGYIGYCTTAGLISGRNETTFDPDADVTGYEAAKMLLCALGYDAEFNGLTGENWISNTHLLALKNKLSSRTTNYEHTKKLTRNNACQMILNALQATMVDTVGSSATVGDFTVNDNVQNVDRVNAGSDYTANVDGKLQLVEELFPGLKKIGGDNDAFGRPTSTWALNGVTLGTYLNTPAVVAGDAATNGKAVYAAIGKVIPETVIFYQDGKQKGGTATLAELEAKMGMSQKQIAAMTDAAFWTLAGAKIPDIDNAAFAILAQIVRNSSTTMNYASGTITGSSLMSAARRNEVYYDAETGALTCCSGYYYGGKVTAIVPDSKDSDGDTIPGYITIDNSKGIGCGGTVALLKLTEHRVVSGNASSVPAPLSAVEKVLGSTLNVGDYAIYYIGQSTEPGNSGALVQGVKPLSSIEGVIAGTQVNFGKSYAQAFYIDDLKYNRAGKSEGTVVGQEYKTVQGAQDIGKTFRVYYIELNGVPYFMFVEPASSNQVYVYDAGKQTEGYNPKFTAMVIDVDGATSIVTTDKDYGPMGGLGGDGLVGYIAQMGTDTMGRTVLTKLGAKSGATAQLSLTNSNAAVRFDNNTLYANTETIFVISTVDETGKETFATYTGINEVPSLVGCKYYAYTTDDLTGRLKTVFVQEAILGDPAADKEGVIMKTGNEICRNGETGEYYEVSAILNNEVTTLKLSVGTYNQMGNGFTLFCSYTQGNGGVITALTKLNATKINVDGFTPVEGGNVTINGTAKLAHENILVYTYSLRDKQLKIATIGDLMELQYGTYDNYFTCHENIAGKPLACIIAVVE